MQKSAFQIMSSERVSRKYGVHITCIDHCCHSSTGSLIEYESRTHDPYHKSVFLLILEKVYEMVIVLCERCLSASPLTENETLLKFLFFRQETFGVDIYTFLGILASAQNDSVAFPEVPVFNDCQFTVITDDDTGIHPRFLGKLPFTVDLEIFRVH